MSKFTIYSASGTPLYEGTPTYTGSYRKPGMLEFREINSPEYIDFAPGCYVDYTRVHDEVNDVEVPRRFKIYTVPQVKKQARTTPTAVRSCTNPYNSTMPPRNLSYVHSATL